jgi:hypothetical protein
MPTIPFDVVGPGLLVGAGVGLGLGLVSFAAVIVIEAVVLWGLRWAGLWRSLLAAFLMNLLTTLVGFVFLGVLLAPDNWLLWLLIWFVAWLLSVALEWGVLALMDRQKLRRAFVASLVANAATYLPLLLLYGVFIQLL